MAFAAGAVLHNRSAPAGWSEQPRGGQIFVRCQIVQPLFLKVLAALLLPVLGLIALSNVTDLYAGTTGKLTGTVLDQEQRPVVAATIILTGTRLGAYSDADGKYTILNIPAGTYEVNVSRLGFETVRIQSVIISADQTTPLNIELGETTLTTEEVIVTAERPPVDLNQTSTRATVTTEEIESLPVQDLDDIVNLQAGVVEGHFRGGRLGEVQYQVDGVSVNNAFDNSSMLQLDRSLLQEVQVISGTFDAEYGQAMSGVVNAVLKQGTEKFEWNGEVYGGSFVFLGNEARLTDDTFRPATTQSYQLSLSGPLLLPDTVYLLSARRFIFDDYVYGQRLFAPTDTSDFEQGIYYPTGDGEKVPLGYSREWSGVVKLTNSSSSVLKANYQAIFNHIEGRRNNFAFRYNPDGLSQQTTFSVSHGFDFTYTLGTSTFLNVSLRQNLFEYSDYAYEDLFDPRYDAAEQPEVDPNYERGAVIEGVEFTRFQQKTNTILIKSALTSQVSTAHLVKFGGEVHLPNVEFGNPGHLTFATEGGVEQLVRHIDDPPDFPGMRQYHPRMAAGFLQDQMEWSDLLVRAGFRLDYLDARATVPSDPANPANVIEGAPESVPQRTTPKASLSPRLGIAYPIEDKAAVHFAYGHFYQFPSIAAMFSNANYEILGSLQAGDPNKFGVLGNPDVKPEQTVQYEIGYKHTLTQDLGVDFTVFYKDIRNLLGVEYIETYADSEYPRLTNVDFGNIFGITIALDHRKIGPASISLDYTWQQAKGNSSDPRETATRVAAQEDPRPRLVFFNWDQRHTFNMTVAVAKPQNYSISSVIRVTSGQPYTPQLEAGFGQGLATNTGRKPSGVLIDIRAEKSLGLGKLDLGLFGRVFNLLDTRYFNGMVFPSTGSPDYSRFPEPDYVTLQDPTRFYPPRQIEIGIRLGMGAR